jgi:cytochrome c oxidase subunit II
VLAGCGTDTVGNADELGLPGGVTDESPLIGNLWVGTWIAALCVGVLVWGLILFAAFAYRAKNNDEIPPQTRFNMPIEFLYTATPLLVIGVLFFFTVDHQEKILDTSEPADVNVEVIGQQWSWTFNYLDEDVSVTGTTTDRPSLVLPVGETVRFTLNSPDVIHSFWVPQFYMKMDVMPGMENSFQVTPNTEGTFKGRCAELCGAYHARMLFNVEVVSTDEFEDYIEDLRADPDQQGIIEAPLRGGFQPDEDETQDETSQDDGESEQ